MRALVAAAALAIGLLSSRQSRAACTEAGACPSNAYCAMPDGGAITDGGAGACDPEPCVVKSDCTGTKLCDTAHEPHTCVECVSTADCTGGLVCDLATHTCVAPLGFDAGVDGGTEIDAAAAVDAALADAGPPPIHDAGRDAEAGVPPAAIDAGVADDGVLGGGACACDLATRRDAALAALGGPLGLALLFAMRRRGRTRR